MGYRVGVFRGSRFEKRVVEVNVFGVGGPREKRINVKEIERFGPVQKLQQRFENHVGDVGSERAVRRRKRRFQHIHCHRGADFDFVEFMGFQGGFDFTHRRHDGVPGLVRGTADDFVADEEIPDFGFGVKGDDVGFDPGIG